MKNNVNSCKNRKINKIEHISLRVTRASQRKLDLVAANLKQNTVTQQISLRVTRVSQKKLDLAAANLKQNTAKQHLNVDTMSQNTASTSQNIRTAPNLRKNAEKLNVASGSIISKKVDFNVLPNDKMKRLENVDSKEGTRITTKKQRQKKSKNALMTTFRQHDLVWAHVRGFAYWPGVIEEELTNGKYRIHFFGDYSRADITR